MIPSHPTRSTLALALASCALLGCASAAYASDLSAIQREVTKRHDEALKRLQDWIALPSIAAENRGFPEGAQHMAQLALDAGFQKATILETQGKPGVFATLDAGAAKTVGLYFMYDVKQFDPAEWTSPPLEARLVDKPGLGKVIVGRGAVNQKGPEAAFLAALHAIRGAGKKLPVNLVLVAEGEEEIGSPHISRARAASRGGSGAAQVQRRVHAVGVAGPRRARHGQPRREGCRRARARLERREVGPRSGEGRSFLAEGDGRQPGLASGEGARRRSSRPTATRITIDDYPQPRPLDARGEGDDRRGLAAARRSESRRSSSACSTGSTTCPGRRRTSGSSRSRRSTSRASSAATPGPGGKTILPHRAVAKIDLRLVPDMHAADAVAALRAHLAKRGFGDIEVNVTGGYDPTSTPASAALIQAQIAVLKRAGIDPLLWPRNAGSYPGYVFTGKPLELAAGHFGLGHGSGAHAPDEYYVIESANPAVQGFDGAVMSFVEYLYELGK